MTGDFLGKIINVCHGCNFDMAYLYGLWLTLKLEDSSCVIYDISYNKNFPNGAVDINNKIMKFLDDANVSYTENLKGKPVRVKLSDNIITDCRILTEVI